MEALRYTLEKKSMELSEANSKLIDELNTMEKVKFEVHQSLLLAKTRYL